MTLDIEKYMPYLDGYDMPFERKEEIVRIICNFAQEQVDIAFGQHPVQLACEYNKKTLPSNDNGAIDSKRVMTK